MELTWPGWQNECLLGEGSFGKVYRIRKEEFGTAYEAALKVISIPQTESDIKAAYAEGMDEASITEYFKSCMEDIVAEFALMSQLKGNSHIVSYEDHMVVQHEDGIGWDILIRMELLIPLVDYITEHEFSEEEVIRMGLHLSHALVLCQKRGILHRDIKPENIFLTKDGDFKLGDFGVARIAEKTISAMSRKGTYTYMAPEVYKGEEYGYSADLYSLGIVLYRFLNNNRTPFMPDYPKPIQYQDREKALNDRMLGKEMARPANGSEDLKDIVMKACAFQPSERFQSAAELEKALAKCLELSEEDNDRDKKIALPPVEKNVDPLSGSDDKNEDATVSIFNEARSNVAPIKKEERKETNPNESNKEDVTLSSPKQDIKDMQKEDEAKGEEKQPRKKKPYFLFAIIPAVLVVVVIAVVLALKLPKEKAESETKKEHHIIYADDEAELDWEIDTGNAGEKNKASEEEHRIIYADDEADIDWEIKGYQEDEGRIKVGHVLPFGYYKVSDYRSEELLWIVADVSDDELLLLSLYILDAVEWESAQEWCDGFYNEAFMSSEQSMILFSDQIDKYEAHTTGKVVFITEDQARNIPAISNNLVAINTGYSMDRLMDFGGDFNSYWLLDGSVVTGEGEITDYYYLGYCGARPAIRVDRRQCEEYLEEYLK